MRAEQDDAFAAIQIIFEEIFTLVNAIDFRAAHDDCQPVEQRDAERKEVTIDEQRPFPKWLRAEHTAEKILRAAVAGGIAEREIRGDKNQKRVGPADTEPADELDENPVAKITTARATGPARNSFARRLPCCFIGHTSSVQLNRNMKNLPQVALTPAI